MARRKKQPAAPVVNISLTEIDLVAKGTELANRWQQIDALRKQKAEQNAHMQSLIDEQFELASTIAAQIRGGSEARNQASLKANEAGELEVPEKPFAEPGAQTEGGATNSAENPTAEQVAEHFGLKTITPEDSARIESEKVAEGLRVPPSVAKAIAKSGGEVDLSAGAAANAESLSDLADAATRKTKSRGGKKQPPASATPKAETVIVAAPPSSCPECGGKVVKVDDSGVYACDDQHECGCRWTAVVETEETTKALGPLSQQQASA